MPATTTPTDVRRRRPHDPVAPAEPPPARGPRTVSVARGAVVALAVCVVALLLLADALDVGLLVTTAAAAAVVCWLVGVVRPIARGVIDSLLGLVGLMLGAGVGGWHVVRTGVSGTGMEHPRDAPLLGGRTHRQSGGRFLKAGQRPVT